MNTNLIKNAIRNTKFRIDVQEKETPALNYNKSGLLSRTKSVKIDKQKEENDALRLAKMVKGVLPNA